MKAADLRFRFRPHPFVRISLRFLPKRTRLLPSRRRFLLGNNLLLPSQNLLLLGNNSLWLGQNLVLLGKRRFWFSKNSFLLSNNLLAAGCQREKAPQQGLNSSFSALACTVI
jgi:hypothetical protein